MTINDYNINSASPPHYGERATSKSAHITGLNNQTACIENCIRSVDISNNAYSLARSSSLRIHYVPRTHIQARYIDQSRYSGICEEKFVEATGDEYRDFA